MFAFNRLRRHYIKANDAELGSCENLLFDDSNMSIRYVEVATRHWLPGNRVLLKPAVFDDMEHWNGKGPLSVRLTKEEIEKSPSLSSDLPISKAYEVKLAQYYLWVPTWQSSPPLELSTEWEATEEERKSAERDVLSHVKGNEPDCDEHLRSLKEVEKYDVLGNDSDEPLGKVRDILITFPEWELPWCIVDTRRWLPGGQHLALPTQKIKKIDWAERAFHFNLSHKEMERAPDLSNTETIEGEDAAALEKYRVEI